jgi:hypothetical protein
LDTKENLFGNFRTLPIYTEKCTGDEKRDTDFLFSLRNPPGIPPRKFWLKDESTSCVERDQSTDIWIAENCTQNNHSSTGTFGQKYQNDSGYDGRTFFTGAEHFTVREMEVFAVTDKE